MPDNPTHEDAIAATRRWVEDFVVELQLCPFARRELEAGRVHFVVTEAANPQTLLQALQEELLRLQREPEIETTLLIHPAVLQNFADYNQFLDLADALLQSLALEGSLQLASFHPHYRFAGTQPDDAENFTNRSPYPMLHILRESSVEAAIAGHPDVDGIPERNIALLQSMDSGELRRQWRGCLDQAQR